MTCPARVYLTNLKQHGPTHQLRSADTNLLILTVRTKHQISKELNFTAALALWNSLPQSNFEYLNLNTQTCSICLFLCILLSLSFALWSVQRVQDKFNVSLLKSTVIKYHCHYNTIYVFDYIRENVQKMTNKPFHFLNEKTESLQFLFIQPCCTIGIKPVQKESSS